MRTIYQRLILTGACLLIATITPLLAEETRSEAEKLRTVYAMYTDYKTDFPKVVDIEPQTARDLLSRGEVLFVDVRKPAEITVSTIPGAIDKAHFLDNRDKYTDKVIVPFCTISYRSGLFAQEMADKGIAVQNLRGGILAWVLEGGRIVDRQGETKRLHVYGPKWDLAPAEYETLTFGWLERVTP